MFVITKKFRFESSHKLPHHLGACKNLHGHSYVLEVSISSEDLGIDGPATGMVMDFSILKNIVNPLVDRYDHAYLNDFFENPTAELMVKYIADYVADKLPEGVILRKARLYETVNSWAEWVE